MSARGRRWRIETLGLCGVCLAAAGCAHRTYTAHPPAALPSPSAIKPAVANANAPPVLAPGGYTEEGIASWYGPKFNGHRTSSGEIYDMYAATAAHRTLPFGSLVRVTNLANGRQTEVRINDRGPFVANRVIDLSYAAARDLGMVGPGTAPVRIEIVGAEPIPASPPKTPGPLVAADRSRALRPLPSPAGGSAAPASGAPATTPAGPAPSPAPAETSAAPAASEPPAATASVTTVSPVSTAFFGVQMGAFHEIGNAERLEQRLAIRYSQVRIASYDSPEGITYRVRVGQFATESEARHFARELRAREHLSFLPFVVRIDAPPSNAAGNNVPSLASTPR